MNDLQKQIAGEVRRISTQIEALTGLPSNRNGQLTLVPSDAGFRGMKLLTCDIQLRADLAERPLRWRTLIHEAFHAVSAGYNQIDFNQHIGWEEGVVEQLQRTYRPRILEALEVSVDESVFALVEQVHPFNIYIDQLSRLQQALGIAEETFLRDLISTPIKSRYQSLLQNAKRPRNEAALYALSAIRPIMESTNYDTIIHAL